MKKILLFSCFTAFYACKTTSQTPIQPVAPVESYDNISDAPLPSTVVIPVSLEAVEIENTINKKINGVLLEDYSYDGDNTMMKVMKSNWINVWFDGQNAFYRVPVSIWVKRNLTISELELTGEIALKFKTFFKINENWTVETYTNVEGYDWIKQPIAKAGIEMNVTSIANMVIERQKATLSALIDKQVRDNFNMKDEIQKVWNTVQQPVKLNDEFKTWVKITPKAIKIKPISTANNTFATAIGIESLAEVLIGDQPAFRPNTYLPYFQYADLIGNDFLINVGTDIPFTEAEGMAKKTLLGQEFGEGNKKVKVEDIRMYGQGDKMVVETKLSGTYNGNVYSTGKPFYNPETKSMEVQDLDFELDTKNVLFKGANFLFHKKLATKLKESMKFPISEQLGQLKGTIQQSLTNYVIAQGIVMNGTVEELELDKTMLTSTSIKIHLKSKGKLNLAVKGLE
jgi:hypothetical protein